MRRAIPTFRLLLASLFAAALLAGCSKKPKPAEDDSADATPEPIRTSVQTQQPQGDGSAPGGFGTFIPVMPNGDGMNPPVEPMPTPMPMPSEQNPMPNPMPKPVVPVPPDPKEPPKVGPMLPPPVVQPNPALPAPPPMSKESDKKDPPMPMGSLPKEPEWPREIDGRDAKSYVKDIFDPDPSIRVIALRTLPGFGPTVKTATTPDGKITIGKALLSRMNHLIEKDPGVRLASYAAASEIGFEKEDDIKEAIRLLAITVDQGAAGGQSRIQALQTLATLGPKAEAAIPYIIGQNVASDPSFETRRSLAATLGLIAYNEKTGPHPKALHCLTAYLIKDESVAVRLEAMQALVVLGPPIHKINVPDSKNPGKLIEVPATDAKTAEPFVRLIKMRLAPAKKGENSATGLVEVNRQVEIWARVALMRFDEKEINENLDAITKYIHGSDRGGKIQALAALGMLGPVGARRIDDVVKALESDDPEVVFAAVSALVGMGPLAKPAIQFVEMLKGRGKTADEKKFYNALAEEAIKAIKESDKPPEKK